MAMQHSRVQFAGFYYWWWAGPLSAS